ncbi:MAG: class I SAM-dependent methyltransferase [Myxococcales bacterium]|nr:class I SAM-dependent methyltransferase [Myxococcales bacterium]
MSGGCSGEAPGITPLRPAFRLELSRSVCHNPRMKFDLVAGTTALYLDPVYYDYEYRGRLSDVRFYTDHYLRHADAAAPVLELGVGSGRIALKAVRKGANVLGLDLSTDMLDRCEEGRLKLPKASRDRLRLVQGDMRAFNFEQRFPLISCPFNAFMHLYTNEDAERCLTQIRRHLAPDGLFLLDVLMPDLDYLNRPAFKTFAGVRFKHPRYDCHFTYAEQTAYDAVTQLNQIKLLYDRTDPLESGPPSYVVELSHRYFFPAELLALLHGNGFQVRHRFGDFEGGSLDAQCESQVLVCGLT